MKEGEPKFQEEKIEEPKRETGVSKKVGFKLEDEESLSTHLKDIFEQHSEKEVREGFLLKNVEREKTESERKIISAILEKMPNFIKKYGGDPVDIGLDHIHFLDNHKLDKEAREKLNLFKGGEEGGYNPGQQLIYVIDSKNNLQNAETITHEIIHFNSFQSVELTKKDESQYNFRRVGFEVRSKEDKEIFFVNINEAITEELVKRFDAEYFSSIPEIADEVKDREKVKKAAKGKGDDISSIISRELSDKGNVEYVIAYHAYPRERKQLDKIIRDIYNKFSDKFNTKEDVFKLFAKAAMDGKLLEISRLIEETYGKGYFRRIGEATKRKFNT
ncbi:MAG: hypothetical protein FJZ43_03505 [Candidatus Staskawiczbacteria bacterium]|nr:hypothetical protein [Candidatus Staskawiczbacteria bacterium]